MGWEKVRYLVAKPRKGGAAYYWQPTPKLIAAGFSPESLSSDKAAAILQAEALNAKIDALYAGTLQLAHQRPRPWSLAALDDLFQTHHTFKSLRPRTQRDYEYAIKPALAVMGDEVARQITRLAIMAWVSHQIANRGPSNARNSGAALRRLMAFGRNQGWLEVNHATDLDLPTPSSRARVWTLAERDRFCAAADAAGHPSISLAVMLGWCLGQRPADLRTLPWTAYDGSAVALRQSKTGQRVWVPALPELRRLLDAASRKAVQIVVSEETGRPYQESAFQHEFARIRARARLPDDLQFRDLRRTLATALGAAGCTDDQIRAVTGHQTREVVAVYVRPDRTFAEGAIKRLEGANRAQVRRAKLDASKKTSNS